MSHFTKQLTETLHELSVDDEDETAPGRVMAQVNTELRRRRRYRAVVLGSGVAAAAVLVAGLYASGLTRGQDQPTSQASGAAARTGHNPAVVVPGETQHRVTDREGVFITPDPGEPCYGAESMSIQQLAAATEVPVWMPDDSNASVGSLAAAWNCGGDAALTFTNGVWVYYESGWSDVGDAAAHWAAVASQNGGGYVTTVLGQPALIGPPGAIYGHGEVDVIVDGDTAMTVYGNGDLTDIQLIAIADSITVSQPLPHT